MTLNVKAVLAILLLAISALMLFVPVAEGADEVRAMFVLLTGIAIRDYFSSESQAKNLDAVKQAYDPTPPPAYIPEDG